MPLYDYICQKCKNKFEMLRKFSDSSPVACPKCASTEVTRKPATFITGGDKHKQHPHWPFERG
ncbi:zinc ribbon domain-containing protein [Dehalogenimonas sp. 4OHTPN]|uniref:Zinc ribbon domain-containing protein n=1 Tax=Dehalogenimonas sp. 4OHTPN TaxID=3166643 RepID=A0AAU8G7C6_9CHLR